MSTGGVRAVAKHTLRSASTVAAYRRAGAALTRHHPGWLMRWTETTAMIPVQRREEFVPFLELVRDLRPQTVLEIGTSYGGTFFMLCQAAAPTARLASVDLVAPGTPVETFGRAHQQVTGIIGSSSDPGVRRRVAELFPEGVDVVFVDGDHSYEGVRADYEHYRELVRPGGILALHDIVPDSEERTGVRSLRWAGGVPKLWREITDADDGTWWTRELVGSWDDEGFGIGLAIRRAPSRPEAPPHS
jgi:cephalosporin hydroxylase